MNNNILGYVVFNENTLGCLFPFYDVFILDVLGGKILQNGADWKNGPIPILPLDYPFIRMATQKDFESFNISSKYYFSR